MYKLQKYRGKKVTRKKDSRLSLSRKSCRRRCRVKTKRCHIRSYTRRFRKYTIKRGNKRVRKNTQRRGMKGGKWWWRKPVDVPVLDNTEILQKFVEVSKANEEMAEKMDVDIVKALKNYIEKQYPLSFGDKKTGLNFFGETNAYVTKLDSGNKRMFNAAKNRHEYIYIFVQKNGKHKGVDIYYIVRCAKRNGCPPRFTTFSELKDSVVEVDSVYGNILQGISRPLKGMEREVLRLTIESVHRGITIFKKVDDDSVKYRIKINFVNSANSVNSVNSTHSFYNEHSSSRDDASYSARVDTAVRAAAPSAAVTAVEAVAPSAAVTAVEAVAPSEAAVADIQVGDIVKIKDALGKTTYKVLKVNIERKNAIVCSTQDYSVEYTFPFDVLERVLRRLN